MAPAGPLHHHVGTQQLGALLDQPRERTRVELAQVAEELLQVLELQAHGLGHLGALVARQLVEEVLEEAAQQGVVGIARVQLEQQGLDRATRSQPPGLELLHGSDGPGKEREQHLHGTSSHRKE